LLLISGFGWGNSLGDPCHLFTCGSQIRFQVRSPFG
jgi:hypothetical protein